MNIREVEPEFAQKLSDPLKDVLRKLSYAVPEHYTLQVSLLDARGRKKRGNAAASNWSPESGRIEIRFEPVRQEQRQANREISSITEEGRTEPRRFSANAASSNTYLHPAEEDLLRALDRAESRPGWNFVPLKKFRDEILPQEHFTSLPNDDVGQRNVLRWVIEKKFVLLGKVPNPRAPQFPVTTIRLNRLMPEVKALLGQSGNADLDFRPIEIPGEPLSATILRDRR